MRNTFLKSFSLFVLAIAFTACSKGDDPAPIDDNNNNNGTSADQTIQVAQAGTWRITSFIDSGENKTSDFAGYEFSFNANGTLVATNGTETISGTWSVTDDSANSSNDDDGNSTDDDDFIIFFAVPDTNKFDDLIDDWDFISVSATKIALIDISGGNGGTDYLTFEKL
jgi:Lipocalin-like domain